jgi:Domain of unknown function (DUF4160)
MNLDDLMERKTASVTDLPSAAESLAALLSGGYGVWTDRTLYNVRQLVARVHGLRIEVFAREHPPPHFHISGGGIDATFSLVDCTHLEGRVGARERALIEWWYERSRLTLVRAWNESRPSECPVGPLIE